MKIGDDHIITRPDGTKFKLVASHLGTQRLDDTGVPYRRPGCDGCDVEPDPETAYCRGARDGECNWKHCPQLRDDEPQATGRHCPYDHWCYYCGEDETDDHFC